MYREDSDSEAPDEQPPSEHSDSSDEKPQRRRLQKGEAKRKERIDIDEFDSDASAPIVKEAKTKPIELKEFQKVVLKRKDFSRWIDHEDFREGLVGAFVRVTYHRQYVVAIIEDFKVGIESYRLNQIDTKWQIVLRNMGQLKQFKLNMISDGDVVQAEFDKMRKDNSGYNLTQEYLGKKLEEISEATRFQYDQD